MVRRRRVAVRAVFALALAGVGCSGGSDRSEAETTTTTTTDRVGHYRSTGHDCAGHDCTGHGSFVRRHCGIVHVSHHHLTHHNRPVDLDRPGDGSLGSAALESIAQWTVLLRRGAFRRRVSPLEGIGNAAFPAGTYAFGSTWTPDRPDMLVLHISRYVRAPCATVGFDPFGEIAPGTCPEDQLTTGESMDLTVPLDESISVSLFSLDSNRYECPSTPNDVFLPDTTVLIGTGVNLSSLLTELERDIDTWLRQPLAESQDLEAVLASYQGRDDTAFAVPPASTCVGQTFDEMSWGGVPGREAIWRGANGVNLLVQDVGRLVEGGARTALSPTGLSTDYDGRISLHFYTGYSP